MPDDMDKVQSLVADTVADALARHHDRPRLPGLPHCENVDCTAPISALRQDNGARLCLDCQEREEAQAQRRMRRGCR